MVRRRELSKCNSAPWPLSAQILRAFSRSTEAPGGTQRHVGDHALDFIFATVPNFLGEIEGKSVLDYGCGRGDQALAIARAGAARVVGYDPFPKFPVDRQGVEFVSELPTDRFDVVLNCSAFEHFAHPEAELASMRSLTGGKLIITWAEPWYSNNGSHMGDFIRIPWVNLLFPERSVMLVRSLYRDDGATSYETCGLGGAVNRMTVARFEKIVKNSGMRVEYMRHHPTRGLPLVTKIPVLRELLTSACTCILSA
jgi:SAM-dependent methyltransferase